MEGFEDDGRQRLPAVVGVGGGVDGESLVLVTRTIVVQTWTVRGAQ